MLVIEPRQVTEFALELLLSGGDGLRRSTRLFALAPHLLEEVEIDEGDALLLLKIDSSDAPWTDFHTHGLRRLAKLLRAGLLLSAELRHRKFLDRAQQYEAAHWHGMGALLHTFTRWEGVDAVANMHASATQTASSMRKVLGAPPPEAARRGGHDAMTLPWAPPSGFDDLLARRATCRNFDASRKLPLALFAQLLQRVFAAQGEVRVTDDTVFLKKSVPSGGGLHPMEAYLIVQHVEGVAPGLYHYQAQDHTLAPLPAPAKPVRDFMLDMVAQQTWFADAHVMVLLSPRFDRTFWKYRKHAKGYRVVAMEAGHLSQTLYLAATDAGLGAFITAAINEVDLERAFGLDPLAQGALAMCGFGWRGPRKEHPELDPAGRVWASS